MQHLSPLFKILWKVSSAEVPLSKALGAIGSLAQYLFLVACKAKLYSTCVYSYDAV